MLIGGLEPPISNSLHTAESFLKPAVKSHGLRNSVSCSRFPAPAPRERHVAERTQSESANILDNFAVGMSPEAAALFRAHTANDGCSFEAGRGCKVDANRLLIIVWPSRIDSRCVLNKRERTTVAQFHEVSPKVKRRPEVVLHDNAHGVLADDEGETDAPGG